MSSSTKVPVKALRSLRALRFQNRFQNLRRRAARRWPAQAPPPARNRQRASKPPRLGSATPPPQRSRTSRTAHRSKRTPSASRPRARSFFQSLARRRALRRAGVVKSGPGFLRRLGGGAPDPRRSVHEPPAARRARARALPLRAPPNYLRVQVLVQLRARLEPNPRRRALVRQVAVQSVNHARAPAAELALVARVEVRGQRGGLVDRGRPRLRGEQRRRGGGARGGAGGEAEATEPPPPATPPAAPPSRRRWT